MGIFDNMKLALGQGMNAADKKAQEIRMQADLSRVTSALEQGYASIGKAAFSDPSIAQALRSAYPELYASVSANLEEERNIRQRIESLQQQAAAGSGGEGYALTHEADFRCPRCNAFVALDMSYCPSCGDNLASLKQAYRMCPNCGTYHTADSSFCIQCGSRTVEVPVAPPRLIGSEQSVAVMQPLAVEPYDETGAVPAPMPDGIQPVSVHPVDSEMDGDAGEEWGQSPDGGFPQQEAVSHESTEEPVGMPVPVMRTCPKCGAPVKPDYAFCGECGTAVDA